MRNWDTRERGFTLVEVAIIVLALAILGAILVPNLGSFNRLARFTRMKEDLQVICSALKTMLDDVGENAFHADGNRNTGGTASGTPIRSLSSPPPGKKVAVGLMIGDGDIPDASSLSGTDTWRHPPGTGFNLTTDGPNPSQFTFGTDFFNNHLIQNTSGQNVLQGHRTPADMLDGNESGGVAGGLQFDPVAGEGFNSLFAWRGPYLADRVVPDPWGNRYMANTAFLFVPQDNASEGFSSATVCYSAGPDEQLDTVFNQPGGWTTGDDDHTVVLSGGSLR